MAALKKTTINVLLVCLVLAGCGGTALRWEHRVHVVRAGESLQTIAFRYGVDKVDLAAWNSLDDPDLIFAGQTLRLTQPAGFRPPAAPASAGSAASSSAGTASRPQDAGPPADSPVWTWPADGILLARFGKANSTGQGIDIGGKKGDLVLAAAAGSVVYSGGGLLGYGKLIILKHNNTYLSAYGHNNTLLVQEGDSVTVGQRIAKMGVGPGDRALLHFEIRRKGQPVDPIQHLPAR